LKKKTKGKTNNRKKYDTITKKKKCEKNIKNPQRPKSVQIRTFGYFDQLVLYDYETKNHPTVQKLPFFFSLLRLLLLFGFFTGRAAKKSI
jgi:hypothetical protein